MDQKVVDRCIAFLQHPFEENPQIMEATENRDYCAWVVAFPLRQLPIPYWERYQGRPPEDMTLEELEDVISYLVQSSRFTGSSVVYFAHMGLWRYLQRWRELIWG